MRAIKALKLESFVSACMLSTCCSTLSSERGWLQLFSYSLYAHMGELRWLGFRTWLSLISFFPIRVTNVIKFLLIVFDIKEFSLPDPKGFSCFSSVQFGRSVVSDSLRPHEPQHARPPCPSPTPGVHPHPCPSSRWCHPAISSSVVPFSSCPQSLPASGSFPISQLFTWGGQSIEVSASASVLPVNTQAV